MDARFLRRDGLCLDALDGCPLKGRLCQESLAFPLLSFTLGLDEFRLSRILVQLAGTVDLLGLLDRTSKTLRAGRASTSSTPRLLVMLVAEGEFINLQHEVGPNFIQIR